MHAGILAVLRGEPPDRIPFVGRLELWHTSLSRAGLLPPDLSPLTLTEIHQAVGMGQQKFLAPYSLRLQGVEVIASFEGEEIYHETDPVVDSFPELRDLAPADKAGVTAIQLNTPVGRLTMQHVMLDEMIRGGTAPYPTEHLIKEEADYRTVEYILERAEYVPGYDRIQDEQARLGKTGFVVPQLHRLPFQQILIDYVGEVPTFYALHDSPQVVHRLAAALDQQMEDILRQLANFDGPYVEFVDNLDGTMTNPLLFAEYCLPAYQRYTERLHQQGKKVGSHTDGNLKPLLSLLAESGLDVCESFSPAPLTECPFEEAWAAWRDGPIIWGGIPSPLLEDRTEESDFRDYIERLLQTVGDRPVILNVVDMMLGINSIDRVRYIAERLEQQARLKGWN